MSETILEVKDLKTHFFLTSGVAKAVDGVSFSINKGETLGIVGESGSGKSVTAKSIIRLLENTAKICGGEVRFEGRNVLEMTEEELLEYRGKDIGMIFQDPMTSLDPVFRVSNQMTENLLVHSKMTKAEAKKISVDALASVGIPNPEVRFSAYPFELSGGMTQRVIIAMALSGNAKLIIADEPTTALDVTVQAQVLKLLKALQRDKGVALLLITHNLGIVWQMCDNVMVMYAGKTVEYTSTSTLYDNPLHPYTWGLFDSMPAMAKASKEPLKTIPGVPPDLRLTGKCCGFYNRCPYAKDICANEPPPLVEVDENHLVACHFQTRDRHLGRERK